MLKTFLFRLKEVIEKVNKEKEEVRLREQSSQDLAKKTNRQLRDLKEEFTTIQVLVYVFVNTLTFI